MDEVFALKPKEGEAWDVAIIGSGPAALTAAIYTTRGAASSVILGGEKWGGQLMLTTGVDNFPGFPDGIQGPDLMMAMRKQAERFGAEFIQSNVQSVDLGKKPFEISSAGEKYLAKTIVIATGAATLWLDAPGISKLIGRGVSSCAPCDAPFFKDKNVAVVGGGDSAMEEALVLTKYATSVTIIHRRDAFRASQAMQQKVMANPKVKILWNTEVVEAKGEQKLEKAILKNNKDNTTSELALDGIFIAIGHRPESELFKGPIELDEKGYIKVYENSKTNVPGIFVAGDVHDWHYRQAVTAAGYGCMAGMDVLSYLAELKG
ncbi:thioredoxin-disulfide reductase [Candidatus Woesebacteria bacterium RBG_13_46_13]|uniref:Thioredoxin reductase n=1 Tax=Candidatus Woesebacteria bacterium RBG_13_46_13 TaxID=1802479 RepID=A0A1F7X6V0_9BACT|nr:MAG: thioredoxin-disulfide reductase [Candidatus Woesebacteria bacterium RBG_13_46_13]